MSGRGVRWAALVMALMLAAPTVCSGFLWAVQEAVTEDFTDTVVRPFIHALFGGGTAIVYDAITFNFLGIKDFMREVTKAATVEILGFLGSTLVSVIGDVVATAVVIIYEIISKIIEWIVFFVVEFFEFVLTPRIPLLALGTLNLNINAGREAPALPQLPDT